MDTEKKIIVSVIIYKFKIIPYVLKTLEFEDPTLAITSEILTEEERDYYGSLPIIYTEEFKEYLKTYKYEYEKYVNLL